MSTLYIIIPPNTAQTLQIMFEENPLGKTRFVAWWQCSVTEILKENMYVQKDSMKYVFYEPEWYQSNFLSNGIQT